MHGLKDLHLPAAITKKKVHGMLGSAIYVSLIAGWPYILMHNEDKAKRLRPQELLPFPWEQEDKENAEAPKDLGKEESQRRFERLVKQSSNTF